MKIQMTKIALMLILATGFASGQESPVNVNAIQFISFVGTETGKGTYEALTDKTYGNSFVMNGFGESETHHLTVSLDYSCSLDSTGEPCEASNHLPVTGGSWSLVVFRNNIYAGTLYGEVSGGAIDVVTNRNGEPGFRQMQINFQATGGLGRFAGRASANISGVYEAFTVAGSNQTSGSVNLIQRLRQ